MWSKLDRFKKMLSLRAIVAWFLVAKDVFPWVLNWLGKLYDIIDTVAYARKIGMTRVLSILDHYGWAIGLLWLTAIAFWPDRKAKDKPKEAIPVLPIPSKTSPAAKVPATLLDVYQEPEDPSATYKWKLRIVVSNDTRQTINIQSLTWKGAGKISFLIPPTLVFKSKMALACG